MKLKQTGKKILSAMLAAAMTFSVMASTAVSSVSAQAEGMSFADTLEDKYVDPDRVYSSEVRWWLDRAAYTDEVLLQELQAMYDGGFRGVELCMRSDSDAPDEIYAYGSDMWSHKWKLMMNKLLDLGMTVSLTSGTNWSTTNVAGLDPDSQEASQVVAMGSQTVDAGETVTALPKPGTMRESNKGQFIGAYAYRLSSGDASGYVVEEGSAIDLSTQTTFTEGETIYDQAIEWTAPDDGDYVIFAYWTHGNYVTASPAAETCYAVNYFDDRGVAAMREFWETHYLDDPELNAKILEGDVQLFMDSIEITPTGGITWWSEDMRNEFIARKGYDPLPYLFLVDGLPQVDAVRNAYYPPAQGSHDLAGDVNTREKFVNDWVDILTQLYCENLLAPMKEWLNSVGIKTRAQISYGRSFEITEPSAYVDYPEAEIGNQYGQADILRLHTAGAKLQNKVLSTETGTGEPTDSSTMQQRLFEAYSQYAVGFQRVIWHIWSSTWSYGENSAWPGSATNFDRWGTREATARDFDELNAHMGRVQQLMQTGKSRTDVGFIHNNWNQGICFGAGIANEITSMNWEFAHMGVYYRSTELQDNGYSYDYLSPDLLKADGVYFDETTKTIEPAGYKALVIYQDWMDPDGAELILDWAQKGLPIFIMEGAAERTPFNDGRDAELAGTIAQLESLENVRRVEIYDADDDFDYFEPVAEGYDDGLYEAMQELGVRPYAEYIEPNHQLLTQTREDEAGNRYLYAYNYCPNDYHQNSWIEEVQTEDHGTNIQTEIKMDGMFIPYQIDAWSGEVTEIANYYYEDGQTVFPIDLDYNNVALFAFEAVDEEKLHITDTNAESAYTTGDGAVIRATESGEYYVITSDGSMLEYDIEVPEAYDIANWDLTVESWNAGTDKIYSEETIGDVHTINTKVETAKTDINVELDKLTTWNNIPEIGKEVSGLGHYEATFNWDASTADGAYLDFGNNFVSTMEVWINDQKVGGDISSNPTKAPQSIVEGYEGSTQYTGGINWMDPVVDISEYLVDGENKIVLEYTSTMGNVQFARGAIKNETEHVYNWWTVKSIIQDYGPEQAVIVPFVEETIEEGAEQPVISATAPESAQVNEDFVVSVVADSSITDVKLFNENDMALGRKDVQITDNQDGTKTFDITISVGTVGNDRTFKVVTKGAESYYKDSGVTVSVDITSVPASMASFELPESAVANRTFIVTATTDLSATKIEVYNETGMKMGIKSLSSKVVDGQKVWTGVMSIGTQGDRTFSAYAVNKYGARSEALTDTISVKAFA